MRLLLSALTSLSIIGGAASPLLTKSNLASFTTASQSRSIRVSLGRKQVLAAVDETTSLSFNNIYLDVRPGEKIEKIQFQGGGLLSDVHWGSDRFVRNWSEAPISSLGIMPVYNDLLNEEHWDGLAYHQTQVGYSFHNMGNNNYSLTFHYRVERFWSPTITWGELTIGDALVFVLS